MKKAFAFLASLLMIFTLVAQPSLAAAPTADAQAYSAPVAPSLQSQLIAPELFGASIRVTKALSICYSNCTLNYTINITDAPANTKLDLRVMYRTQWPSTGVYGMWQYSIQHDLGYVTGTTTKIGSYQSFSLPGQNVQFQFSVFTGGVVTGKLVAETHYLIGALTM